MAVGSALQIWIQAVSGHKGEVELRLGLRRCLGIRWVDVVELYTTFALCLVLLHAIYQIVVRSWLQSLLC